jgi:2,3-diketo-5-methylthio-1-phosphopentane phosphatase
MNGVYRLAAFDFDYTILNANSNNVLSKLIMERELAEFKNHQTPSTAQMNHFKYNEEIERLGVDHKEDNTIRCNAIYEYMHSEHGITRKDMEKCLRTVEIGEAWTRLFKRLQEADYDLIIISDSNTFLIETILKQNDLIRFFQHDSHGEKRIYANKAGFDKSGCLRVKPLNSSFNENGKRFECGNHFCKKNICKGAVLERYLAKKFLAQYNCVETIYVGDGKIDYCAGTKLNTSGRFLVRKNMALHKLLHEGQFGARIKAKVEYWKNAEDILKFL